MESGDLAANGFPSEKPQTLTLADDRQKQERQSNDSDEELETPNGSEGPENAAVNVLHGEIQDLRRDRSELQRRIDEMLAETERSEVATKALAAHASFLEGELARTQKDLASASSAAGGAEKAASSLRSEIKRLTKKIADVEAERGEKDGEIKALKEAVRVSDERRAVKEEELKVRSRELEARIDELVNMSRDAMEEEDSVRVSREEELGRVIEAMKEKNSELEGDQKSRREVDLGNTAKVLKERNSELEGKIAELSAKEKDSASERNLEMDMLRAANDSKVSWAVVAAAAASTGTVAAVLTAFYLRNGRLRT